MATPCRHLLVRVGLGLLAASVCAAAGMTLGGTKAAAVVAPGTYTPSEPGADSAFPMPDIVRKQMRFWELIFYRYPSTTVLVHEAGDPEVLIDVIDYKVVALNERARPVLRKDREEIAKKYVKRYALAVDRFYREGKSAVRYGPIESRLFDVYNQSHEKLARLLKGDLKIRAQTGLADDFKAAAAAAQPLLPAMEQIFTRYGVPRRLTRLPFVESMFSMKARSKVGASGIWQFMPETARNYIFVNSLVDERNAPLKATRAAAQFLMENFRSLGTWPLAITAYNHGALGMSHAVKQVGTKDLGKIIDEYDSPSFGFASSNFYAEFLAAQATYERLVHTHQIPKDVPLDDSEPVILQQPVSIAQLLRLTTLTKSSLAALNPCLLDQAFTGGLSKPLPAYYELRVPGGLGATVRSALNALAPRRFANQ